MQVYAYHAAVAQSAVAYFAMGKLWIAALLSSDEYGCMV